MARRKLLGVLCSLGFTLIFAIHYQVAKEVLPSVNGYTLSWIRAWTGGALLAALSWRTLRSYITLRLSAKIAGVALLGFGLNQVLFLKGLMTTTASNAALLSNTIPIVTLTLSLLLGLEPFKKSRALGVGIAFTSVALMLAYQSQLQLWDKIEGNLLILASVVFLSSSFVLSKKYLHTIPAQVVSPLLLLIGGCFFALLSGFRYEAAITYATASGPNAARIFFEIVFSTALAYYLNFAALRYLKVSTVMMFAFLQLPFTSLIEFIFYNTTPRIEEYLVLGCIAIGLFFVLRDD